MNISALSLATGNAVLEREWSGAVQRSGTERSVMKRKAPGACVWAPVVAGPVQADKDAVLLPPKNRTDEEIVVRKLVPKYSLMKFLPEHSFVF